MRLPLYDQESSTTFFRYASLYWNISKLYKLLSVNVEQPTYFAYNAITIATHSQLFNIKRRKNEDGIEQNDTKILLSDSSGR